MTPTTTDPAATPTERGFVVSFDDATCLPDLRAAVRSLLTEPRDLQADAELVCTELVSNAIDHAAGPRSVLVAMTQGGLTIAVLDASPHGVLTPGTSRLSGSRGHGLTIVQALSHWGITRTPVIKTVWATLVPDTS